jgi:hypothetical protein
MERVLAGCSTIRNLARHTADELAYHGILDTKGDVSAALRISARQGSGVRSGEGGVAVALPPIPEFGTARLLDGAFSAGDLMTVSALL